MMRRGLWQQKQRHPSACLLCRFSYSYGPYTRPAPRSSSSHDGRIADSDTVSRAPPSTLGQSRLYSVAAGSHGGLSSTSCSRNPASLGALARLGTGRVCQRSASTRASPSWATVPIPQASSSDGLLPHERAAREKAMSQTQPAPSEPEPAPAPAPAPASAPAPAPKRRGPAWASAAPSWATPAAQPAAADAGPAQPPQQADPLAFLLPHERAAREKAAARKQPQPASPSPLLPHERVAKESVAARAVPTPPRPPPKPASSSVWDEMMPQDDVTRDYISLQRRRRRPPGMPGGSRDTLDQNRDPNRVQFRDQNRDQPRQPSSSATAEPGPLDNIFKPPGGSDPWKPSSTPRYDLPRPSSALAQSSADQSEWKNLARRERTLPPGFPSPQPGPTIESSINPLEKPLPLQGNGLSAEKDPWKTVGQSTSNQPGRGSSSSTQNDPFQTFAQSTPSQPAQGSASTTGGDPWKLLEQSAEKPTKAKKKQTSSTDEQTWAWADGYTEEAKQLKVQRVARELQQEAAPAQEEASSTAAPSRQVGRETRSGRADRHGRGDRLDRSDKPKKPKVRRKEDQDDDWDDHFYEEKRRRREEKAARERQRLAALAEAGPTPIFLPEYISVTNLADALGQKTDVFVRQLEELGFEDVSKDNILTGETAALVAQEYGFEPTVDAGEEEDLKPAPLPADLSSFPLRPPVVTIMGHVDHGKTTLLDYLRKSSIVSQEHGGITQHIGAFSVSLSGGQQITFLDTPGHAAFLSMRQRGANVTDMVILVVAADDSVMPQTLEALKHARAAKVPIIVAINKVDKPEANVDRVKSDLAANGVEIEDYGGDVQVVCVSGKTGQGMADLEENILLLAEMLDIRADPNSLAEGWVLESTIKPLGRVATILVKRGTLRPGDFIVAGCVHAKVRSLRNEAGVEVDEATPGTAVEVLGWKEPPVAGDMVLQAPDEGRAKAAVRYRQELKDRGEIISQMAQQEQDRRERDLQREREQALEDATGNPRNRRRHRDHHASTAAAEENPDDADQPPAEKTLYVPFLVKGDVHGSVEAVTAALLEQGNNEIRAKILVSGPGMITESDVEHAAVSNASIINFNNAVPSHIKRLASEAGVKIIEHNVIYHLVEEVRDRLAEALPPLVIKKVVGEAEVLQVFPINIKGRKYKNIAGCRIGNGYVKRGSKARVIRGGENIFEGTIETLKHVKKDVDEMKKGSECGMSFAGWDELQAGDSIQMIEEITEKRKL